VVHFPFSDGDHDVVSAFSAGAPIIRGARRGVAGRTSQMGRRRCYVADEATRLQTTSLHLRRTTGDASPETLYLRRFQGYAAPPDRHGGDVLPADLRRARAGAAGGDRAG